MEVDLPRNHVSWPQQRSENFLDGFGKQGALGLAGLLQEGAYEAARARLDLHIAATLDEFRFAQCAKDGAADRKRQRVLRPRIPLAVKWWESAAGRGRSSTWTR